MNRTLAILFLACGMAHAQDYILRKSGSDTFWAVTSGTSVLTSLRVYVDPVNGNDATAVIGDLTKPYASITNAVTAANARALGGTNIVVMLAPHTNYNCGPVSLNLSNNVSLKGSGRYASVILGAGKDSTNSPIIQPSDNSSIEDLSVVYNGTIDPLNIGEATIGWKSGSSRQGGTNIVVRNIYSFSGADGIYISTTGKVDMAVYDSELFGLWDVIGTIGDSLYDHTANYFNCKITFDHRNDFATNGAPAHGIFADNGTNNFYGGSIVGITTNTAQHSLMRARGANGVIQFGGGMTFYPNFGSSVSPLILRNDGGGKIYAFADVDLNNVAGAIAWKNTNAWFNSITSPSALTMNVSNYLNIASGGGTGGIRITNALPELHLVRTDGAGSSFRARLNSLGRAEWELVDTALSMNWETNGLTYIEMMNIANMSTNAAFIIKSASANGPYTVITVLTNGNTTLGGGTGTGSSIMTTKGFINEAAVLNTTAATTITTNCYAGRVRISAASQTYFVTNTIVTANSICVATVNSDDTTATDCKAIPAAALLTLKLNAAATANTDISFQIVRP